MTLRFVLHWNMENEINIQNLLTEGEHISLECKTATKSVPNSVWDTYSAFANTNGGIILLGVSEHMAETDNSKRFEIVGVENADKICKDIWNIANSKEKVSINLLNHNDVLIQTIAGKEVVIVNVPRAEYTQRPVYINNNFMRGSFKRNHEGDYHCTEQEVKMMLRDANEAGNDGLLLEYYTMDDIDLPTLKAYRMMFSTINSEHVWNGLDNKEFLQQLGGYTINRKEGMEGLTLAGLLMFGKGLPVRERFDNLRMDYIDKSHLIGDQRYSDRLTYDGTWENNIFNFMRLVLPKLTRELPRPFQMEGMIRNDDTLQHKAVREAVTNMIIHSDFMLNGLLRIEKYDDRIVLTNPGLLKLPLAQIYSGGESKARNQRMQNMFRMIGFGENLGSGFPLILHAWDEKHWTKPELIEQAELMQVKLVLWLDKGAVPISCQVPTSTRQVPDKYPTSKEYFMLLLKALNERTLSIKELMKDMGLKDRENFMEKYLTPSVKDGYVQPLYPSSPHHPKQKYLLTEKGKQILQCK